jgi:hypothetical protein
MISPYGSAGKTSTLSSSEGQIVPEDRSSPGVPNLDPGSGDLISFLQ